MMLLSQRPGPRAASHATWSRCASLWNIFVFFCKHSLPWDSPLDFILEGVMPYSFFNALWLEHFFSMLLEHILFFQWPLSPYARLQEEKSLWTLSIDFGVTPGVQVSMYMRMYVISIMEAWKDSTKVHNNLAKLNGSHASICRRFMHWYRHMALLGNMTIEELALFYFQKEIIWDFTIL
jgi:hypothetical protein